jgi:hypothetical protein
MAGGTGRARTPHRRDAHDHPAGRHRLQPLGARHLWPVRQHATHSAGARAAADLLLWAASGEGLLRAQCRPRQVRAANWRAPEHVHDSCGLPRALAGLRGRRWTVSQRHHRSAPAARVATGAPQGPVRARGHHARCGMRQIVGIRLVGAPGSESGGPRRPGVRERPAVCVLDEYTREGLAIRVGRRLDSRAVIDTLAGLVGRHGPPAYLRSDKGGEFIAARLEAWLGE